MLALAVSMVMMLVWFIVLRRHFVEIAGKYSVRPLFSPCRVFLFSRISRIRFWEFSLSASLYWEGSASWVNLPASSFRYRGC